MGNMFNVIVVDDDIHSLDFILDIMSEKYQKNIHIKGFNCPIKALNHAKTYDVVLELLNDSNVNVVSMAYLALAQRGDAQAIREILNKIKVSDNWYSQMYAYRALRALGWTQDRSH